MIKRYDIAIGTDYAVGPSSMEEEADGDWVRWEDFEAEWRKRMMRELEVSIMAKALDFYSIEANCQVSMDALDEIEDLMRGRYPLDEYTEMQNVLNKIEAFGNEDYIPDHLMEMIRGLKHGKKETQTQENHGEEAEGKEDNREEG